MVREIRISRDRGIDVSAGNEAEALGRRFEDAISRLTDDQEVIAGIKAFLRLLRTDPAS